MLKLEGSVELTPPLTGRMVGMTRMILTQEICDPSPRRIEELALNFGKLKDDPILHHRAGSALCRSFISPPVAFSMTNHDLSLMFYIPLTMKWHLITV